MKKIFQLTSLVVLLGALVLSCAKTELNTDQFDSAVVALKAYGPQPVVRGGILRFVGSNLDKVATVTIPGVAPLTPEVVTSGVHSEIRVTVPKDGPEPGYPVLTLKDGGTITAKTQISYSEPISIDSFSPAEALPGAEITIKGDYLNLIHEVIFANEVIVSEKNFVSHDRYTIKVKVPATAQTGKLGLGTVDETVTEDENLLASLNIIETETDLVVTTAKGTVAQSKIKAGETLKINGTNLDLTEMVELSGATVVSFKATASTLEFVLPESVSDGDVVLVMASGVMVSAGSIETVVPTELAATPAPIKNGGELTISGKDLDLVTAVSLPGSGSVEFAYNESIKLVVPESGQAGDINLELANGKIVTVDYTLVEPTVTGFSANPASAGSDVTLIGTDLDLVAAVWFAGADPVEVEASETEITVAVPTAAETGVVVLCLKNDTTVETIELAIDKPAGAYIASMPGDLYSPGDMFIIDIENADHLIGVQFDGEDVNYILNKSTLYVQIPSSATANTTITLVSDNGSVTYAMNIDPGDFIVTPIWNGPWECAGWNGNQELAWGGYDWSTVAPGMILRLEFEPTKPAGEWFCISLRHGDSWGNIPGLPGQYDSPESPLDVVLTAGVLADIIDNGGLVITGDGYVLKKVSLVQDLRYGDPIWEGEFVCDGWNGNQELAWGGYDWSQVKAGQTLYFHMTSTVAEGEWWCISLRHGDSWGNIPGLPGQYDSPAESPMGVKLTQESIDDLVANGGLVMTGTGYILTKVSLK